MFSAPASPINPGFNIHYLIKNQIWKYPINTWFIYKMLDLEDTEVKTFMRPVNLGIKHWSQSYADLHVIDLCPVILGSSIDSQI